MSQDLEEISTEDRRFFDRMDTETKKIGKHYQLLVPFKNSALSLPNNRKVAEKRLISLKNQFLRDPKYWSDYKLFIQDLLTKGYARKSAGAPAEGNCWYIPRRGVYNPNKPKIRVVFDCSSKCNDRSLNSEPMFGPDSTDLLLGVLIRFRQDKVAFMGDIESIFYQVRVAEEHCSFLRFLWWENDDLEKPPADFEMLVHIFGGTSSPACSTYTLKRSFIDYEVKNNKDVEENLKEGFYVDDLLQSVHNVEKAKVLVKEAIEICAEGGFRLTKFTSNIMELLESIPEERRKNGVKNQDITGEELPVDRALDIQWNIEEDKLEFKVKLKEKPMTRRGMLSIISSIYDPLRLLNPYLLKGKKMLQNLWYDSLGWDEEIPENVARKKY